MAPVIKVVYMDVRFYGPVVVMDFNPVVYRKIIERIKLTLHTSSSPFHSLSAISQTGNLYYKSIPLWAAR